MWLLNNLLDLVFSIFLFITSFVSSLVHVYARVPVLLCVHHSTHTENKGQLVGLGSFFPHELSRSLRVSGCLGGTLPFYRANCFTGGLGSSHHLPELISNTSVLITEP